MAPIHSPTTARHGASFLLGTVLSLGATPSLPPEELHQAVSVICAVGPEGQGNAPAAAAWQRLVSADLQQLPIVLAGMDQANPIAANWLRAAVETIVARQLRAGAELPLANLGRFLLDASHHPGARRLAFELIRKLRPETAEQLLPGMLNDPSLELRRDAVQKLLDQATQSLQQTNTLDAILLHAQALGCARDVDQIQAIAQELRRLGQTVDLPHLFGFLMRWNILGPFHNLHGAGFQTVFPPENTIDPSGIYNGKSGPVQWRAWVSTNELGKIDLNQACGQLKEVTAYAHTEFVSQEARPAELRLGCKNAWKVWLNGQLLFGRDEYHRGAQIDQYRMPAQLRPGTNSILVKICQNEMVEDWTVEWEFQLRICDSLGTPIRPAPPPPSTLPGQPSPNPSH